MKRIYHSYDKWECFHHGMYKTRKGEERERYVMQSLHLLRNPKQLKMHMDNVVDEWLYSTEVHITARNSNRQAFLGQAACCHAHGSSESETREAWGYLTPEEADRANAAADEVLKTWEEHYYEHQKANRKKRI